MFKQQVVMFRNLLSCEVLRCISRFKKRLGKFMDLKSVESILKGLGRDESLLTATVGRGGWPPSAMSLRSGEAGGHTGLWHGLDQS